MHNERGLHRGNSGQPGNIWRQRRAVALVVLGVVAIGSTPLFIGNFDNPLHQSAFVMSLWAFGILASWLGGRIHSQVTGAPAEPTDTTEARGGDLP